MFGRYIRERLAQWGVSDSPALQPTWMCSPTQPTFLCPTDDVLHTLSGAMSLLRRCRVNAALTIQLFSQLFHFINMWLFNRLVTDPESGLCSHYWGAILRQQLGHVEAWAEKQGLELAADCHLSRIVQVGGVWWKQAFWTGDPRVLVSGVSVVTLSLNRPPPCSPWTSTPLRTSPASTAPALS